MRFLEAKSQRAVAIDGKKVRVGGRTPGESVIIVVVCPKGILRRQRVIKPRHPEIFLDPRPRIDEGVRGSGWTTLRVVNLLIGRGPEIVEIGQHAGLQI